MLVLYVKSGCPFCAMVLKRVDDLNLHIEEKNIADEGVADELIEKGGKRTVPYLEDTDRGEAMYESKDIVAYLDAHYSGCEDSIDGMPSDPATCRIEE